MNTLQSWFEERVVNPVNPIKSSYIVDIALERCSIV